MPNMIQKSKIQFQNLEERGSKEKKIGFSLSWLKYRRVEVDVKLS